MVDQISALQSHIVPGKTGPSDKAAITISEVPALTLCQIAAWPETLSSTAILVAKAAGASKATAPGKSVSGKKAHLLRVEPLKWWLLAEGEATITPVKITPAKGCALDLSHSRTWLNINGENAETLLNHFLPLDLRTGSFPQDSVANTAFHHIGVTLWRNEAGFNLLLPRSFAASLWEIIAESAQQYGFEIK